MLLPLLMNLGMLGDVDQITPLAAAVGEQYMAHRQGDEYLAAGVGTQYLASIQVRMKGKSGG